MHELKALSIVYHRGVALFQGLCAFIVTFFYFFPTLDERDDSCVIERKWLVTFEFSASNPLLVTKSRYERDCTFGSIQPFPMAIPRRGIFNDESRIASANSACN